VPGEALLHPLSLCALAALVVNDHWLKDRWGTDPLAGAGTGKLSDVAGLAFFPLLLVSLLEVARWSVASIHPRTRGVSRSYPTTSDPGWAFTGRELALAVVVTGVGFVAVQTVPWAGEAYSNGLAGLRWSPGAMAALVTGQPLPPLPAVNHTMDVTDVMAVPGLWLAHRIGHRICTDRAPRAGTVHSSDAVPQPSGAGPWRRRTEGSGA
jgi:hypothetical protein